MSGVLGETIEDINRESQRIRRQLPAQLKRKMNRAVASRDTVLSTSEDAPDPQPYTSKDAIGEKQFFRDQPPIRGSTSVRPTGDAAGSAGGPGTPSVPGSQSGSIEAPPPPGQLPEWRVRTRYRRAGAAMLEFMARGPARRRLLQGLQLLSRGLGRVVRPFGRIIRRVLGLAEGTE
jgi:hypothetical protein